jgi:hypothetical protein
MIEYAFERVTFIGSLRAVSRLAEVYSAGYLKSSGGATLNDADANLKSAGVAREILRPMEWEELGL